MMSKLIEQREIVSNYQGLVSNLDDLITASNFKMDFFLGKLNMKRSTFYNKRKTGKFEPEEVDKILKLLAKDE